MTLLRALPLCVILAAGAAANTASSANAQTVLRYAEFGPSKGWWAVVHKWFAAELAKRTNGELKLQTTFGGALLKARSTLKGIGSGVADIGTFVGVYTPREIRNYRAGDIPNGIDDPWSGMRAAYEFATTHPAVFAEFDRQRVKYISNFTSTSVILNCRKPITGLSQLKGLRIRANPPQSEVFKAFGATVVPMPFPQVYRALDRGLVDCTQNYWVGAFGFRTYEVAKHFLELNWSQNLGYGIIMNKARFDSLKPEHQKILVQLGSDLVDMVAKIQILSKKKIIAAISKMPGVTINEVSAADHKKLIAVGLTTGESFKKQSDAGVLDAFVGLVRKYEAMRKSKGYPWARK